MVAMTLPAQDLESVELKASDLVTGNAENDLIALAESAKIARKPVVVMAPDSWRQQIAGLLRKAWPQIQIQMKKSPSGKMRAYLLQETPKQNTKALAPEVKLERQKPAADFAVEPVVSQPAIQSVQSIGKETLTTPGLVPLGKPAPAIRTSQHSSGTKLRSRAPDSSQISQAGEKQLAETPAQSRSETDAPAKTASRPIQTRSRKFVSQSTGSQKAKPHTPKPDDAAEKTATTPNQPASDDPVLAERRKLERIYNKGKTVKKKITVRKLKLNDVLYVWPHNILVVRKTGATKRHFWLIDREKLDLNQPAIRDEGNHLYRIRGKLQIRP